MLSLKLFVRSFLLISMGLFALGCSSSGGSSGSAGFSSEAPSGLLGAVASAVAEAGVGAKGSNTQSVGAITPLISSSDCDTHGDPAGGANSTADQRYPGYLTYCKLSVNDYSPDTIQGSFTGVKGIVCAVERSGLLAFDGVARTGTMTLGLDCFTQAQLTDMGVSSATVTITGSAPASFNSYYEKGIVLDVTGFGTYKVGAKVTATKIEVATYEEQSATKVGTTFGSLDFSTGILRAEARMQRIDCPDAGSCGWNRHWRVYANLAVSGTTVTDLNSISFAYSNIQAPPGQGSYGGVLVTTSGDMTSGIKARAFTAGDGLGGAPAATSDYYTAGNWTEVANVKCYLNGSEVAATCGTGIDGFSTNAYFVLESIGNTAGTTQSDFFSNYAGATFTAVDPNVEGL
jgi:hypothetical protein